MLRDIRAIGLACAYVLALCTRASAQSFPWAKTIPRTGWTVTADSFQVGNEPENVLDGDTSTIWHTKYTPDIASLPHYIQIDSKFSCFRRCFNSSLGLFANMARRSSNAIYPIPLVFSAAR